MRTHAVRFVVVAVAVPLAGLPLVSFASVRIAEIMYDAAGSDEGREYVVVRNGGESSVDLADITFSPRADQPDKRLREGFGGTILRPGARAVIVSRPEQFSRHYDHVGIVPDSGNFSLLNTGSTVALKRDGVTIHTVVYDSDDGASGDGEALHVRPDGRIVAGEPSLNLRFSEEDAARAEEQLFAPREETKRLPRESRDGRVTLLMYFSILVGVVTLIVAPLFLSDGERDDDA